ncbi:hypothetical protein HU200_056139 [Digitaria exilis]|uniref:Uncharacterized protein n=1 Tax=Digitaria exilis TaxID=1010633 RepID=A0A835AJN2_9POAL|nr:hypothetical protein HU200_056139 [Digitaria exilis]
MAAASASKAKARNKHPAQDEAHTVKKLRKNKRQPRHDYETGRIIRRRDRDDDKEDGASVSTETVIACLREADCLASCRGHHGVVEFKNIVRDEEDTGEVYIVMDLLGLTLRSLIITTRPSPRTRCAAP